MANFKESNFKSKFKEVFSNRAVIAAVVTILAATLLLVAISISANRSKLDTVPKDTGVGTVTDNKDVFGGEDTLPTYNGTGAPQKLTLQLPVSAGVIAKDHDPTIQVYSATMGDYRVHLGWDIATEENASVMAIAAGKVERVWEDSLMGTCVAIDHGDADKTVSIYKNLAKELASGIEAGATVKAGQQIGVVGDTAILELADEPHLHFELTVGGISADPGDYFDEADVMALSKDNAYESGK